MKKNTEMRSKPIIEDYLLLIEKLYGLPASQAQFEAIRAKIFALVDSCPANAEVGIRITSQYRLGHEKGNKGVTHRNNPVSIKTFIKNGFVVPDDIRSLTITGKPFIKLANGTKLIASPSNEVLFEEKIIIGDAEALKDKYPDLETNDSVKVFTIEDIADFSNLIKIDYDKKFEL